MTRKITLVWIAIIFGLISGCSAEMHDGNKIIVQKQVSGEKSYETLKEIEDDNEVQEVERILQNADWESKDVTMAYPPLYKFQFENDDEENQSQSLIYKLWISPGQGKVELVIGDKGKYVQLSEEKSVKLFKLIAS